MKASIKAGVIEMDPATIFLCPFCKSINTEWRSNGKRICKHCGLLYDKAAPTMADIEVSRPNIPEERNGVKGTLVWYPGHYQWRPSHYKKLANRLDQNKT
jgi:ribosomal protein L37AE/L43A